jgi:serine protease inhibitor
MATMKARTRTAMTRRLCFSITCVVVTVISLIGCSNDEPLAPVIVETFATPEARTKVNDGSAEFAFDLYRRLGKHKGNLVVSPVSVATALGMVLAGARGETEQEIAKVLHVAEISRDEAHRAAADLQNDFNGRGEDRDYTLAIANRLWAQVDHTILDEFSALLTTHYGADIGRVDFINKPSVAVKQVNAWAARATGNKIPHAIGADQVNDMTRLILVNAVYFKAKWILPFKERNTEPRDFFRTANEKIPVPTMLQTSFFPFRHVDGVKLVRLPYEDFKLGMVIILPDDIDGLEELEVRLTLDKFREWANFKSERKYQEVTVSLPKFKFEADLRLNEELVLLGMPSVFDPKTADFSGIDGVKPTDSDRGEGLFIQHVIHRAFIDVDEQGTEAAATTAATKEMKSAPHEPLEFRADHPFLFLIHDEETGAILFMGRVTDPSKE